MIELASLLGPILQTGAVGAMLLMVWRESKRKDQQREQTIRDQNDERREMYKSMEELVKEVTIALTYKNTTDSEMADALKRLAEQLRAVKVAIKELKNEASE